MENFGLLCLFGLTLVDDVRFKRIRVFEVIFFGMIGVMMNCFYKTHDLISVLGGVAVGIVLYIFSIISKEMLGKGDALMIMAVGVYLGFSNTLLLVWISSIIAALVGGIYLLVTKKNIREEIPFVPFLLTGYSIMLGIKLLGGISL